MNNRNNEQQWFFWVPEILTDKQILVYFMQLFIFTASAALSSYSGL